jgi:hypothetical protein
VPYCFAFFFLSLSLKKKQNKQDYGLPFFLSFSKVTHVYTQPDRPNPIDQTRSTKPDRPNAPTQIPPTELIMAAVHEELKYLTRVLTEKRTRLIQELRELDRTIAFIDYLNANNHQLRTHIQSLNRRHSYKRVHSPTFSDGDEEEGELKKSM